MNSLILAFFCFLQFFGQNCSIITRFMGKSRNLGFSRPAQESRNSALLLGISPED
jgi:hypothetical protein